MKFARHETEKLLEKARSWDKRYLKVTINAINYAFDDPSVCRALIDEFLSSRNRNEFSASNPHSKDLWLQRLLEAVRQRGRRRLGIRKTKGWSELGYRDEAIALVTFTHRGWVCNDKQINFDLARAKKKIRNAMDGLGYIACFEPAIYTNEVWTTGGVTGKLICFHCHAIVWASSLSSLKRWRKKKRDRFDPILGNQSGARIDQLATSSDVLNTVLYLAKMPYHGYATKKRNGRITQRSAKISLGTRARVFMKMKDYRTSDFWFGGGTGRRILQEARKSLPKDQNRRVFNGSPEHALRRIRGFGKKIELRRVVR